MRSIAKDSYLDLEPADMSFPITWSVAIQITSPSRQLSDSEDTMYPTITSKPWLDNCGENCSHSLHVPLQWLFSNTEHLKVLIDQVNQRHTSTWWVHGMHERLEQGGLFPCKCAGSGCTYLSVRIHKFPWKLSIRIHWRTACLLDLQNHGEIGGQLQSIPFIWWTTKGTIEF